MQSPHLEKALGHHTDKGLTILSAKTGYGKTHLVDQWTQGSSKQLIRYPAPGSSEPISCSGLWETIAQQLSSQTNKAILTNYDAIQKYIDSLIENTKPNTTPSFIIFIDDFHLIADSTASDLLAILKRFSTIGRAIIATQKTPPKSLVSFYVKPDFILLTEEHLQLQPHNIVDMLQTELKQRNEFEDPVIFQNIFDISRLIHKKLSGWPSPAIEALRELSHLDNHQFSHLPEIETKITAIGFKWIEQKLFNKLDTELSNSFLSLKFYPSLSINFIKSIYPSANFLRNINELCTLKLLKYSEEFNGKMIPENRFIDDFRIFKNTDLEESERLQKAIDAYNKEEMQIEAIFAQSQSGLTNQAINQFEKLFPSLYESGHWHHIQLLVERLPIEGLLQKIDLFTDVCFAYLINQKLDRFYRLLEHLLKARKLNSKHSTSKSDNPSSKQAILWQIAKNYAEIKQNRPENLSRHSIIELIPEIDSEGIESPEICILLAYKSIFDEKNIESAYEYSAHALENSINTEHCFLCFHSLILYNSLSEHLGELDNIQESTLLILTWSHQKYFCEFPMRTVARLLNSPFRCEKQSRQQLETELCQLELALNRQAVKNDPLIQAVVSRALADLYTSINALPIAVVHYKNFILQLPNFSLELSSLITPSRNILSPSYRKLFEDNSNATLSEYTRTILPPFEQFSPLYHYENQSKPMTQAMLQDLEVEAKKLNYNCIALICNLFLVRYAVQKNMPSEVAHRINLALEIASICGHTRVFHYAGDEIMTAIQQLNQENPFFYLKDEILNHSQKEVDTQDNSLLENELSVLSKREREILALLVTGKSNEQIAQEIHRSIGTVKLHVHKIYKKLDIKNRLDAISRYRHYLTDEKQ